MTSQFTEFFARLGVSGMDEGLARQALTHSSRQDGPSNERLEFLGDRVLGLVVADALYGRFAQESEGDMALRHAALVKRDTLASLARGIALDQAVSLSASERKSQVHLNDNVLADAMEAVIGAVYRAQGYAAAHDMVMRLWQPLMDAMPNPPQDPKTALQEWAQARGLPVPVYQVVARDGPDHAPSFTVEAAVQGHDPARAGGPSRSKAEKEAARLLLERVAG